MMTNIAQIIAQLKSVKKGVAKKQKGFTLIELAIIIAIIGIMSSVAVTQFIDLTGNAEEAVLSDYLQKLNTGVASYMAATGHRPDDFEDFIEDFRRRKFDNTENYREILVFDNKKEIFCRKFAKDIMLGDIVKVNYS